MNEFGIFSGIAHQLSQLTGQDDLIVSCAYPQEKTQVWIMAKFWLFIANSIGILILVLLLVWMLGGI